MTIYNVGSVNIDHVYMLDHFPAPGETLPAKNYSRGLGGKGANQSIAAAKAGAKVVHVGAIGRDDEWVSEILENAGVNVSSLQTLNMPTGHAVICVDVKGENQIVIHSGANAELDSAFVSSALESAAPGDWLVLQNETGINLDAATIAQKRGMKVAYSAAPFDSNDVCNMLPLVDLLIVNQGEHDALLTQITDAKQKLASIALLVTKGAAGAEFTGNDKTLSMEAYKVNPVDTTGAGDTFAGYFIAGIDKGLDPENALKQALAAAAIQITLPGAAEAIPGMEEVLAFMETNT